MQCQLMYLLIVVLAALHSVHIVDAVLGDYDPITYYHQIRMAQRRLAAQERRRAEEARQDDQMLKIMHELHQLRLQLDREHDEQMKRDERAMNSNNGDNNDAVVETVKLVDDGTPTVVFVQTDDNGDLSNDVTNSRKNRDLVSETDAESPVATPSTPTRTRSARVRNCWFSPVQCLLRGRSWNDN